MIVPRTFSGGIREKRCWVLLSISLLNKPFAIYTEPRSLLVFHALKDCEFEFGFSVMQVSWYCSIISQCTQSRGLLFASSTVVCSVERWGWFQRNNFGSFTFSAFIVSDMHIYEISEQCVSSANECTAWKDRSVSLPRVLRHRPSMLQWQS